MGTGKVRLRLDSPFEEWFSLGLTTLLRADDAEQIQGVKLVRAGSQHTLQFTLGLVQLPGGERLRRILDKRQIFAWGYCLILRKGTASHEEKKQRPPPAQ